MKILFLGAPGTGKGTYARRLKEILGVPHISTGDMFREEVKSGSDLGKLAQEYMMKPPLHMVPDEVTIKMVEKRLSQDDCKKGFMLDGFPRNLLQAKALDKMTALDVVILLYIPEDVLLEKLTARRVCKNCGDIYNIADINRKGIRLPPMPPKKSGVCDKCGGELVQRKDDSNESIMARLKSQAVDSEMLKYYEDKKIVKKFDVTGPPEEMVPQILELIRSVKA